MPGYDQRPTHCFECARPFERSYVEHGEIVFPLHSLFSEDEFGNGVCKDCTIQGFGGQENYQDHLEERAYGLAGSAIRQGRPVDPVIYKT